MKNTEFLNRQFTKKEIKQVKETMEIVNRCFQKKKIPFSRYLKFGESMAFLERTNLTTKYFTEIEREEIFDIWKSTK